MHSNDHIKDNRATIEGGAPYLPLEESLHIHTYIPTYTCIIEFSCITHYHATIGKGSRKFHIQLGINTYYQTLSILDTSKLIQDRDGIATKDC